MGTNVSGAGANQATNEASSQETRQRQRDDDVGDIMLRVRKDLCLGCGLCVQSCPRGAISLLWGQAEIDQNRCNSCCRCLEVCPQGAIVERITVSKQEMTATVANLKQRTDDLLERIESLKR